MVLLYKQLEQRRIIGKKLNIMNEFMKKWKATVNPSFKEIMAETAGSKTVEEFKAIQFEMNSFYEEQEKTDVVERHISKANSNLADITKNIISQIEKFEKNYEKKFMFEGKHIIKQLQRAVMLHQVDTKKANVNTK